MESEIRKLIEEKEIEAHLVKIRKEQDEWVDKHPEDVNDIKQLARQTLAAVSPSNSVTQSEPRGIYKYDHPSRATLRHNRKKPDRTPSL